MHSPANCKLHPGKDAGGLEPSRAELSNLWLAQISNVSVHKISYTVQFASFFGKSEKLAGEVVSRHDAAAFGQTASGSMNAK